MLLQTPSRPKPRRCDPQDLLINDLENDENIEQFDFDLFSSQDNPNDKLIANDEELDKLDCDQDTNNNDTNSATNAFYPETNQVTDRFRFRSHPARTRLQIS